MSRIGRLPVAIPAGVEVTVADGNVVTVKGPKGTLERALPTELEIKVEDGHVVVTRPNDLKRIKALHGLTRSLIHNMVVGVSEGYKKELEVNGVGYRAAKQGKKLVLNLGYSHPVEMEDPEGLESTVDGNKIIVSGISKEKVGQYAAEIRSEPVKILLRGNLSPSLILIVPALHKHIIHHPDSQQIQIPNGNPQLHTPGEETGELSFHGLLHEVFFSLHIRPDVHPPQLDQLRQNLINTKCVKLIQPVLRIIRNRRIRMLRHHIRNVLKHLKGKQIQGRLFRIPVPDTLFQHR